jgi:hypothetical protein
MGSATQPAPSTNDVSASSPRALVPNRWLAVAATGRSGLMRRAGSVCSASCQRPMWTVAGARPSPPASREPVRWLEHLHGRRGPHPVLLSRVEAGPPE